MNAEFLIWLIFDIDKAQNFLRNHRIVIFQNPKRVFGRRAISRISLNEMLKRWKGGHKEIVGHIPR
jgi:hypothetical protein